MDTASTLIQSYMFPRITKESYLKRDEHTALYLILSNKFFYYGVLALVTHSFNTSATRSLAIKTSLFYLY